MNETNTDPYISMARLMGFGGLVPFVGCAVLMFSGSPNASVVALFANAVYGAVILSFVGAVHWGLAMRGDRDPRWFIWSVMPAIYAWLPTLVLDPGLTLLALVPGFYLSWWVDYRAWRDGLLPGWYMQLRHILTLGASMALAAGSLAVPAYIHG